MSNGSYRISFEDANGHQHIQTCPGRNAKEAVMRQFAQHDDWVGAQVMPGGKRIQRPVSLPKSITQGFTIGELVARATSAPPKTSPQTTHPPVLQKADREKAAVPFANFQFDLNSKLRDQKSSELRDELRKLDKDKPVAPIEAVRDVKEPMIPQGLSVKDTVLCAAAMLEAPFTIKMVARALEKAGFPDYAKRHASINNVLHTAYVKGDAVKEGRGLYKLNDGARPSVPRPAVEMPPPEALSARPVAAATPRPVPEAPKKAATLIERLATVVASGLMMNADDATILEKTLDMLMESQQIIKRAIQAHKMREALVDAVQAASNES